MNLYPLLTFHFWFNLRPEPLLTVNFWIAFFIFGLCFVLGLVLFYRKAKRFGRGLLRFGMVGLAWLFFLSQRVPLVSARFLMLIWVIWMGIWLYQTLRYQFVILPKRKEVHKQEEVFKKYLP